MWFIWGKNNEKILPVHTLFFKKIVKGLNNTANLLKVMFVFVRNCLFLTGIIFYSSVVLVWTFTTKVNIAVNLVPFFIGVSFQFYCFLKSGATNELKSIFLSKSKKSGLFIPIRTNLCRQNASLASICIDDC